MPQHSEYNTTAATYAQALIELAKQQDQAEPIGAELDDLKRVIDAEPSFKTFLQDPAIGREERAGVIDRAIRPHVGPLVANFIGVLQVHGRLGLLDQIASAYKDLLDQMLGKIEVDVTVAQRLSDEELEQVRQRVSAALKKDAVVRQSVDESIIGGLVLRVEDKLIDASVRSQLAAMKDQLLAARPK
jgi:F-type H+-transporting ATPase subunit delta